MKLPGIEPGLAASAAYAQPAVSLCPGVPNLGYMYTLGCTYLWGYIYISEGVHLRLAIEGQNFYVIYFQILKYKLVNIILKSHYIFIAKYVNFQPTTRVYLYSSITNSVDFCYFIERFFHKKNLGVHASLSKC